MSDLISIDNFDFLAFWDEMKKTADHLDFKGLNYHIYKYKATPPQANPNEKTDKKKLEEEKTPTTPKPEKTEPENPPIEFVPTDYTTLRHHVRVLHFALAGREGRLASLALSKMAPLIEKLDLTVNTGDDWSLLAEYLLLGANRAYRLVSQLKSPEITPSMVLDLLKKIIKKFLGSLKERTLYP